MIRYRQPFGGFLTLFVALVAHSGCGSNDNGAATIEGIAETGADGASSTASEASTSSDAQNSTTGSDASQTSLVPNAGTSESAPPPTLTPDDVCAAVALETEAIEREVPREITTTTEILIPAPVAIYVVLDNSGSMDEGSSGGRNDNDDDGDSKWAQAVNALTDFVNDPESEGVDIGIQYFHPEEQGGDADECDGTAHSQPAVDVAPLPGNADSIVDSLEDTGPSGDTPTVGALSGGTAFCAEFQAQNPDKQCVVVLVTDGQPNGCELSSRCDGGGRGGGGDCVDPDSAALLTPIAATGLSSGVTTFAVGMEGVTADGFQLLDAIAVAGGSDCTPAAPGGEACDVSMTGGAGLLEALNTIRDTVVVTETVVETTSETIVETLALPCQWAIPMAPSGETLDLNLVNVVVEVNGASGEPLAKVPSVADCAAAQGGWYYDVPDAPSSISICPETCDTVTANADVRVQVELGCTTKVADVK